MYGYKWNTKHYKPLTQLQNSDVGAVQDQVTLAALRDPSKDGRAFVFTYLFFKFWM
jgi:hypothetical protein